MRQRKVSHQQKSQDDIQSDGEDSRGLTRARPRRLQIHYNKGLRRTLSIDPLDEVDSVLPERKIELKVESLPERHYRWHQYCCRIVDGRLN